MLTKGVDDDLSGNGALDWEIFDILCKDEFTVSTEKIFLNIFLIAYKEKSQASKFGGPAVRNTIIKNLGDCVSSFILYDIYWTSTPVVLILCATILCQ